VTRGIDYAFSPHPSVSALKTAGVAFVCRYVSADPRNDANGKNLLPAEKTALLGAGFQLVVVCEEWAASRMLGGHAAGVADATHADAVVKALGLAGVPVYFACDFDATEAQQVPINAYLDGCASVIGVNRVGIYGGYYPLKRALDAGKAKYAWQTYAWSGGLWDTRAQLRQVQNGVTVGGASCDFDESRAADFGQWPRPSVAPPASNDAWTYAAPALEIVAAGRTSVKFTVSGPASAPVKPDHYQVFIYQGTVCNSKTIVSTYPREVAGGTVQLGGLARGVEYTIHAVAAGPDETRVKVGVYASARFTTG
jgi:hypothetical protein